MKTPLIQLSSGPPWALSLTVERVGRDLTCHVHGGDWHVGAVALAEWRADAAFSQCLVAGIHKEGPIAERTARLLCETARCSVVCIAGIHFDDIAKSDITAIVSAADELADRAVRQLAAAWPDQAPST